MNLGLLEYQYSSDHYKRRGEGGGGAKENSDKRTGGGKEKERRRGGEEKEEEGRREEEERERNPWLCNYSITTDLEHNSVGVDACHVFHYNKVCFCDAEFDSDLPLGFYLLLVKRRKTVV